MTTGTGALTDEERENHGAKCLSCGHRAKWHHDTAGCDYHGRGPNRCDCGLDSDQVVVALIAHNLRTFAARAGGQQTQAEAALDEARVMNRALYSASWEIVRGAGLLPPPQGVHPAVTWLRDRADALTAALPERAPTQAEPDFRPAIIRGLETRFKAVLAACELAEAEARHVVDDEVYVSVGLIRNALRTSAAAPTQAEQAVEPVRALVASWPVDRNSGQDYRRAVTQCADAITVALDGPDTEEQL